MKKINATYKGLIAGILMIGLSVLFFYGLKYPVTGDNQILILLVYVAAIIWSLLALKKRSQAAPLKFKDYFSEGFKTFVVVTLLMVVFTYVFYKLNPQILEDGIKDNNALLLKQGDHTPAEIADNAKKMRDIFMPMMTAINTIKYLIIGALVTVIGAGFLSQKKN
ncbi:MAG: DUF4199 domain-containing protein [Ferruginibacter sp.]